MRSFHVIILFLCVVVAYADNESEIERVNRTELITALKCIMTFTPVAVELLFSHLTEIALAVWENLPRLRECTAGGAEVDKPTCLLRVLWAVVKELFVRAVVDYSKLKLDFGECLTENILWI